MSLRSSGEERMIYAPGQEWPRLLVWRMRNFGPGRKLGREEMSNLCSGLI